MCRVLGIFGTPHVEMAGQVPSGLGRRGFRFDFR